MFLVNKRKVSNSTSIVTGPPGGGWEEWRLCYVSCKYNLQIKKGYLDNIGNFNK